MKPHLDEARAMLRMADRDIAAFRVLARSRAVHYSIICFHPQQAVEKCLKAVLFCNLVEFRRTHDLDLLIALLTAHQITSPLTPEQTAMLSPCAVQLRYDDVDIELPASTPQQLARIVEAARDWAGAQVAAQLIE